jgi:hypothetical protein
LLQNKFNILIVGKINTTQDKLNIAISTIASKVPLQKIMGLGDKPYSLNKPQGVTSYSSVAAKGHIAAFVKDFIRNEMGVTLAIHSGTILIYNKNWHLDVKKITLKRVKKYTEKKYDKLNDRFIPLMIYMFSTECILDPTSLIKLHKESPSVTRVTKLISNAFGL